MMINHVPLGRLVMVFCILLVLGLVLTLPLFQFQYRKFVRSSLFIKIIFWIPIFSIFVVALYISNVGRFALITLLLVLALREIVSIARQKKHNQRLIAVYYLIFGLALMHFFFLAIGYKQEIVNLLITICFASVLSDVTAFFCGNYLGFHKLPAVFNKTKSWEGVFGQVLGAFIGVILVNAFINPVASTALFLPIGLGSALGDLANSFVKRKLGIKNWSSSIPGHGGYLDRLSSLAGSVTLTFYFLKLFI